MRTPLTAATALIFLSAATLSAQKASLGKLEGTIREKIATRSVSAAWVSVVQLEPEGSASFTTRPDSQGHFRLDSLPAGRYLVQVNSPTLDSLDVALPSGEVTIDGGKTLRADFALPSGAKLRDAVCPGLSLAPGKAVVAGRAIDAATDQPLAGADIVLGWQETSVDRVSLKSTRQRRATTVRTGSRGDYRMCGVPTGRWLSMQLQYEGRAGTIVRFTVSDDEGAVVRDVSLNSRTAPSLAALDSVERARAALTDSTTMLELELTGTAMLTGTVRSESGQPLSGVQVRVRDARSSAMTDSAGRYVLANLPSGTQVALVRNIGYASAEMPVELRPGRPVVNDVRMRRVIALDSIRIVAPRTEYAEFEHNRRANTYGTFFTLRDIQLRAPKYTSELLERTGGFRIMSRGGDVRVISKRAVATQPVCEEALVVIDNLEGMRISDVSPDQIAGMEVYRDAASAPAKYADKAQCGAIVIWLKSTADKRRKQGPPVGTSYNGY